MLKFKAPEHESAISTFAGERRCDKNGIISIESDASAAEIAAIRAAGWAQVIEDPAPEKTPGKPAAKA